MQMKKIANSAKLPLPLLCFLCSISFIGLFPVINHSFALDHEAVEDFQLPTQGSSPSSNKAAASLKDVNPAHVVHWKAQSSLLHPDGSIVVYLTLTTENDFSLYAKHLKFTSRSGYDLKKVIPPESTKVKDPLTDKIVDVYSGGEFILLFQGDDSFSASAFPLSVRYVACTVRICLFPYTEEIEVPNYKSSDALPPNLQTPESIVQAPPPCDPSEGIW